MKLRKLPRDVEVPNWRLYDAKRVQQALLEFGYDLTLKECEDLWSEVSEESNEQWISTQSYSYYSIFHQIDKLKG